MWLLEKSKLPAWPADTAVDSTSGEMEKEGRPPGRGQEAPFQAPPSPRGEVDGTPPAAPLLLRTQTAGHPAWGEPHWESRAGLCARPVPTASPSQGGRNGEELGIFLPLCGSPSEPAVPHTAL